jgi:hypothetical protein
MMCHIDSLESTAAQLSSVACGVLSDVLEFRHERRAEPVVTAQRDGSAVFCIRESLIAWLTWNVGQGMKLPENLRTEVLSQLQEVDSDISKPHQFDFYLYFPTEETAEAARKKLEDDFGVEVRPAARGPSWLCLVRVKLVPKSAPLEAIGAGFEFLASELQGEFDGWEAEIISE